MLLQELSVDTNQSPRFFDYIERSYLLTLPYLVLLLLNICHFLLAECGWVRVQPHISQLFDSPRNSNDPKANKPRYRLSVCLSLAVPLDGEWSAWSPWTQCSKTCGISGGTILRRTRLCNQPPPMNGGQSCPGNDTETARACFTPCPGKFASRLILLWIKICRIWFWFDTNIRSVYYRLLLLILPLFWLNKSFKTNSLFYWGICQQP